MLVGGSSCYQNAVGAEEIQWEGLVVGFVDVLLVLPLEVV